jgi:hypothetical protein
METASKVAEELRKRYDLIFLHLDPPISVPLTAVVRWAVSTSKVHPQAWKAPVSTSVIEEYLAELSPSGPLDETKDWSLVVDEFTSKCDELDRARRQSWSEVSSSSDRGRINNQASSSSSSRASVGSRCSSIPSEGHVSPEDDGPSRKVVD